MSFIADKQTLDDLNIFGKRHGNTIYNIYNGTRTLGGALILGEMFRYPLSDAAKINKRSMIIRYFQEKKIQFSFRGEWFNLVEQYLANNDERNQLTDDERALQREIRHFIGGDAQYELLHKGALATIALVNCTFDFLNGMEGMAANPYSEEFDRIREIICDPLLTWTRQEKGRKKLSYVKMVKYDRLLRYDGNTKLKDLLHYIYEIDVYVAVATVAEKRGFRFAQALPPDDNVLNIEGLYHPSVLNAIPNSVKVNKQKNVIFLTGANMAGKSTFMKSFGIVIYLAHMGFPVPAEQMEFSVQNGIYTTINLPDNLTMGYSHFYSEVIRLKRIAEQAKRSGNLVIIFDELFRGTNVKDAYDATVAVAEAFSTKRNCTFLISTHIIEAGEELGKLCNNINFIYLPTIMKGSMPIYTYKLENGITADRHGMMIINNEHIVDILKSRSGANV